VTPWERVDAEAAGREKKSPHDNHSVRAIPINDAAPVGC
jgi:hypothetical protein